MMKQYLRYSLAVMASIFSFGAIAQTDITFTLTTDCWGGEISWGIFDSSNNELAAVGPNTLGNQETTTTDLTLADGCYELRMVDSYGDGMNGVPYASCDVNGSWSISDNLGNTYVVTAPDANANFGFGVDQCFCLPFGFAACTDPIASNYNECALNDDGSCAYDPPTAAYSYTSEGVCIGSTYNFLDESVGPGLSWAWTFENGTPATSSDQNPSVVFNSAGTHAVGLTVTDANSTTGTASGTVTVSTGNNVDIVIVQDNYPAETSWQLADEFGTVVASGAAVGQSLCIGDGCYVFTINDSYGDGICCGYGNGSYSVVLNGVEVANGGAFAYTESAYINCPPGIDCNNTIDAVEGINSTPDEDSWFRFVPAVNGQYRISTCGLTTCNTTIWMYDYCTMANFDDSNEATLTYNDDLCGVQAEVTPYLEGGVVYYIRIGSIDGSCSGSLDFLLEYMGGIPGCVDSAACNYLPIATVPEPCFYPGDPECPDFGPDLEILGDVFYNSMYLTSINSADECYINEGCLQGFGNREIVRFSTHIKNIGTEDYFIGQPGVELDQFEWDVCHNHWHYEGYAEYVLYDGDGIEMPQIGFKNGFCVLDLECSDGGTAKYTCGNMGISAQCGDIYSSGLSCQWVDITDVPAGSYTLMCRTNWDFSPDANGSYELRYDNNWAAVCISFERDGNGDVINFVKDNTCPLIVDCLGQPFGSAMPDCEGNCPGTTVRGDVNTTGELEYADSDQYVTDILGDDATVTPCTDMNNDGDINVTDAALIAGCVFYGPTHVDGNGVHDHCIFDDEIINPNHNVTLSIGEVNTDLGYVDVYVLNPDNEIVGYEFEVSGLTIQSVENIYDPILFDAVPAASLGGTKIIGYTNDDVKLPKNYSPTPFVRIHYLTAAGPDICVSNIIDIVNDSYHNTMTIIGVCQTLAPVHTTEFSASATTICQGESIDFTDESLNNPSEWAWSFEGGSPANSSAQNPTGVTYNNPGTFNVTLTAGDGVSSDSEAKFDYITVLASATYYLDSDGDGYGDPSNSTVDCVQPAGYVTNADDCDDSNDSVYLGAPGTGQNLDNNCNGLVEGDEILCMGDFNNDLVVNIGDLLMLLGDYGCQADCMTDMNGDDVVNTADQVAFLALYGTTCQ